MTEKYLLVSLEEEKAKKITTILTNDTARKILDFLTDNNASETDVANKLNLPLSTVHYNVQQLLDAALIEIKDFYWSDKGKKVNIYQIAKKYIVITTKKENIKPIFRTIIPIALISAAIAGLIQYLSKKSITFQETTIVKEITKEAAIGIAKEATVASGGAAIGQATTTTLPELTTTTLTQTLTQTVTQPTYYGLWFFFGAIFALLIYLFWMFLRGDKK